MAISPEERAAHCRRIASSGGRKTVEKHGAAWMSTIGKAGFRAALESIGGVELYKIIGGSYEAKFGRALDMRSCRNAAAERQRADCRKAHPELGTCEWVYCDEAGELAGCCGAPAEHRHHIEGLPAGHGRDNVKFYCAEHHRALHRMLRRQRRG